MLSVNVPLGNFSPGRLAGTPNIPDMLVVHTSGNTTQCAINTITNPSSGVSYHFIIAANGAITRAVGIRDTAHANGTGSGNLHHTLSTNHIVRSRPVNANNYTISIAFGDMNLNAGHLTQAQINSCASLMNGLRAEIFTIWGTWTDFWRTNFVGHNEVKPRMRDGTVRHCPQWSTAVPFPYTTILDLFHSQPILLPFSANEPIIVGKATSEEGDLSYSSYYDSEIYDIVHGSSDDKWTEGCFCTNNTRHP